MSFREEYEKILKMFEIDYDERFLFKPPMMNDRTMPISFVDHAYPPKGGHLRRGIFMLVTSIILVPGSKWDYLRKAFDNF